MHTHLQVQGVESIRITNRHFAQNSIEASFHTCELMIVIKDQENPVYVTLFSKEPLSLASAIKETPSSKSLDIHTLLCQNPLSPCKPDSVNIPTHPVTTL